ncbi:MAG: DUF4249 domain-containing protein [Bacteroidota bacterium]
MKKIIPFLALVLFFSSCIDEVEIDLESSTPRLVIDAGLQWQKGTSGNEQEIKLSKSRDFFDDQPVYVSGAIIYVEDENGNVFHFEEMDAGTYQTTDFIPEIGATYHLYVEAEGEEYEATETLTPVTEITNITESEDGGFGGGNREVRIYYNDPAGVENFYLSKFYTGFLAYPDASIYNDEFTDGSEASLSFSDEDLSIGDEVTIQLIGISEAYFNYLNRLFSQVGGNPFDSQPASVRGNIVNQTNQDNFCFGYFSISEVDQEIYEIQGE